MTSVVSSGLVPLGAKSVRVLLSWTDSGLPHDIDLSGLLLTSWGRVQTGADFVFYNQPTHPSGSVRHEGRRGSTEHLVVDLATVPFSVDKVALVASISGGTFADVADLAIEVRDATTDISLAQLAMPGDGAVAALLVGELGRGPDQTWELRPGGRAWAGLAAVATHFGVEVEAPGEPAPDVVPPPPAPQPPADGRAPESGSEATRASAPRADSPQGPTRTLAPFALPLGSATLEAAPVRLEPGRSVVLQTSSGAPRSAWLRISQTGSVAPSSIRCCVLVYDKHGAPGAPIPGSAADAEYAAVHLVVPEVGASPQGAAVVDVNLAAITSDLCALVVAVASADGRPLSPGQELRTELLDEARALLAQTSCPAPPASAALLVSLRRSSDETWFMTALGSAANGRSAKSLVGFGRWALED